MPHTNRLAAETSPYLLQHAHNPVDWYPWGPEAFEKARTENKPIFLSVGYSTCYWCHVMERQCFENETIAAVMNEKFVNIKVDREERPDVDQLYMTAVQILTRQGGWPMSVFLTPALEPFYGGTYFPPEDNYGRPGFPKLLTMLENAYRTRPQDVKQTTEQLTAALSQLAEPRGSSRSLTLDEATIDQILDRSVSDFDPVNGGFGSAPKFPRQTLLQLLLVRNEMQPDAERLSMLTRTLDALADGGIRDHLGGGFHRYSTDAKWLVPHFEIMLYDNAMLGWVYTEAFRQTRLAKYATVARRIFDFILREMTSPAGAFYTAFDAEVDSREGLNYLWTRREIVEMLTNALTPGSEPPRDDPETSATDVGRAPAAIAGAKPPALAEVSGSSPAGSDPGVKTNIDLFLKVYGVDRGPNFADPHHGTGSPDANILYLPKPLEDVAREMKITVDELDARLAPMRSVLLAARSKRKQPLLDTKILTSWNALMIRAMAHAGKTLSEPNYTTAAERAARFLLDHHRDAQGNLMRTSRDQSIPKFAAFLDDYAFLADALLELGWTAEAERIADAMQKNFAGPHGGFYFTNAAASDLIVRQMIATDSPLPSGNGVAASVMLALGGTDVARSTLALFSRPMVEQGEGMSAMVEAAARYVRAIGPLAVEPILESNRPASPVELAARIVEVEANWATPLTLELQLSIQPGYHIQSRDAADGLIATRLSVPAGASVDYPAGVQSHFEFSDIPVNIYDGIVTFTVTFASPPTGTLRLGLTYQPCDERACLPVVTKTLELPISS